MLDPRCVGKVDRHIKLSEDGLLLREFTHRTANEIASATAALRIALGGRRQKLARRMLTMSLRRLEGFGELNALLGRPVAAKVDVSEQIAGICHAIAVSGLGAGNAALAVDLRPIVMEGRTARRLALVAAELILNAVKHALTGDGGQVTVTLHPVGGDVILQVADDGPCIRPGAATCGTGYGQGIVAELVGLSQGTVTIDTGVHGTAFRVVFPTVPRLEHDAPAF